MVFRTPYPNGRCDERVSQSPRNLLTQSGTVLGVHEEWQMGTVLFYGSARYDNGGSPACQGGFDFRAAHAFEEEILRFHFHLFDSSREILSMRSAFSQYPKGVPGSRMSENQAILQCHDADAMLVLTLPV